VTLKSHSCDSSKLKDDRLKCPYKQLHFDDFSIELARSGVIFSGDNSTNPGVGEKVSSCLRRHMEICQAISPAYDGEEYTVNPYQNIFGMRLLMSFCKEKYVICDEKHVCSRYHCKEARNAFMPNLHMFFLKLPKQQRCVCRCVLINVCDEMNKI